MCVGLCSGHFHQRYKLMSTGYCAGPALDFKKIKQCSYLLRKGRRPDQPSPRLGWKPLEGRGFSCWLLGWARSRHTSSYLHADSMHYGHKEGGQRVGLLVEVMSYTRS